MKLCDYGCGQEAKYQFKNGKWCCSKYRTQCSYVRNELSRRFKGENNIWYGKKRDGKNNPMWGKKHLNSTKRKIGLANSNRIVSNETKKKLSIVGKGRVCSEQTKEKISQSQKGRSWIEVYGEEKALYLKRIQSKQRKNKSWEEIYGKEKAETIRKKYILTIDVINKKYPLFSKIEEMRYNPDKPGEYEIQVHCKNHNCPNSKEQGGWFTPASRQISERIRQLEHENGTSGSYFYCSDECKNECPLYNLRRDPFQNKKLLYTQEEYNKFREFVLERDNYKCCYCGKLAEHVHHERPQKLEPFFSLDPDLAWSVCSKCHYKYGHKDECSTGKLANKIC